MALKANRIDYNLYNNIKIIDNRVDKEIIGTKQFGKDQVIITNNQNLDFLIRRALIHHLSSNGLTIVNDKTLVISIENLEYSSTRGLPLGESEVKLLLKAQLISNKDGFKNYSKSYDIDLSSKNFIVSSPGRDRKNINLALEEALQDIASDLTAIAGGANLINNE